MNDINYTRNKTPINIRIRTKNVSITDNIQQHMQRSTPHTS